MVAVVVPRGGECPHRERAWEWVRERYAGAHPNWQLVEAPAPPGPWCKAAACIPAVVGTAAQIVVVADADVWTDGLAAAVDAVAAGAPWAMPHTFIRRLGEEATGALLEGADWRGLAADDRALAKRPYRGMPGGGAIVTTRENWLRAPLDRRFIGWGQEDECQAMALRTLCGKPWRGKADLIHLWHPPQDRASNRRGSRVAWGLRCRYLAAEGDTAAMTALIDEEG